MPHPSTWMRVTAQGLWCEAGDFFIDPVRAVPHAVITHGHSDHARPDHGAVLGTPETLAIMTQRMGEGRAGIVQQALRYGEVVVRNGVAIRLVPAGHVLGSAQVVLDWQGSRIVISGDYKRRLDPTCTLFEPVECDVFVTEATFALPVFRHPPADVEVGRLLDSVRLFPDRAHLVGVYALGKCQRLIALLRQAGWDRPIWLHGGLLAMCELYARHGIDLGDLRPVPTPAKRGGGGLLAGGDRAGAHGRGGDALGAAPGGTRDLRGVRLDAGASARQGQGRRTAPHRLRPRGLGGVAADGGGSARAGRSG
jgi:putative mRNA 3-end processing factor